MCDGSDGRRGGRSDGRRLAALKARETRAVRLWLGTTSEFCNPAAPSLAPRFRPPDNSLIRAEIA
jgi:hypothetical protein